MKFKTFVILLVAAGLLAAVAVLRLGGDKPAGETKMGDKLFADLPIDRVASVSIADAKHRVTLRQGETTWQVEERGGYPADFGALRDTVIKLSRLKIGRRFTGTPESLARLSLLPPTATTDKGRGQSITLKDARGKVLADVILGKVRETEGGGSGGQYLKRAGEDTVFLVDANFRFLKTMPQEWLADEILDIKADTVAEVDCYAADAKTPVYTLSRPKRGGGAVMQPVPAGRSADSAKIEQIFDALAPLSLSDVKRAENGALAAHTEGRTRLVYRLYDGREIVIFPQSEGKEQYALRVAAASLPADSAMMATPAPPAGDKAAATPPTADETSKTAASEKKASETKPPTRTPQMINESLGPWVFSVKKWQYDSFITDPAAMLKPLAEEAEKKS